MAISLRQTGMSTLSEVQDQMSRRSDLSNRNDIPNPAPVGPYRAPYQVHTGVRVNISYYSLLRDNVKALDVRQKMIRVNGAEEYSQLDNEMVCW